jgi:hypothetical protein
VESQSLAVGNFLHASNPIRVHREFDSNETDKSDRHEEKHFEQRISTLDGMTIE